MEQIWAIEAPIKMQENASGSVLSRAALISILVSHFKTT